MPPRQLTNLEFVQQVARAVTRLSNAAQTTVDAASGGKPAREIRLFHFGWNSSTKGRVWFDQQSAGLVMAEFDRQGVDGMIDLEHLSLDYGSPNFDPDARGWFRLEVRSDAKGRPELWIVAKWNGDGARRIVERLQRYLSPAFYVSEHGRVIELINVALVAMPATHGAQELIAASRQRTVRVVSIQERARRTVAAFAAFGRRAA